MGPFLQWATGGTTGKFGSNDNYFGLGGSLNNFLREKISGWDQLINAQPWLVDKGQLSSSHRDAVEQIQSYWMSSDPNILAERGTSEVLTTRGVDLLEKDGSYVLREGDAEIGEMVFDPNTQTERPLQVGDRLATPQFMYGSIGATKFDHKNQKWAWQTPEIGAMEQYLNAIAMVIARYKQPTGRLLADTIALSRQDVNPFGWQNPKDAIAKNYNYFKIFIEDWIRKTAKIKGVKVTEDMIDREFGKVNAYGESTGGLNMINTTMHNMFMYNEMYKAKHGGVAALPEYIDWRIHFPGAVGIGQWGEGNDERKILELYDSGFYKKGIENSNMDSGWSVDDFMNDFKEEMGIE